MLVYPDELRKAASRLLCGLIADSYSGFLDGLESAVYVVGSDGLAVGVLEDNGAGDGTVT